MNLDWYDITGVAGSGMIVVLYFLLQWGKVRSDQLPYPLLNGVGAFLILVSLVHEFNFPAFVIELFWLVISVFGTCSILYRNRKTGT